MTRRNNREYSQDTVNFSVFSWKEESEDSEPVNIILDKSIWDYNFVQNYKKKSSTMSQSMQSVESSKVNVYFLNVGLWVFLSK